MKGPMMNPSCLVYRLTDAERRAFNETGYLVLEDTLSPGEVSALTEVADEIHARKISEGFDPKKGLFYPNFIPDSPLFQDLVDYEKVLPKVWGILGWNIYLYHAHLIVTPPNGEHPNDKTFGWHQDSGRVNTEIECHPRPRLSLKVAYFLSDTSEPGRGNFWISGIRSNARTEEKGSPKAPSRFWQNREPWSSLIAASGTPERRTGRR
jgi:ectoine hydroxylase